ALIESARLLQRMRQAAAWGIAGLDPAALRLDWTAAVQRATGIAARLGDEIASRLRKHGVERLHGEATILGPDAVQVDGRPFATRAILIATGSRFETDRLSLPPDRVWTPWDLLRQEVLPEALVVHGQGGNAVELAQLLRLAGREVTLACPEKRLLPDLDPVLEDALAARLERDGVKLEREAVLDGWEDGKVRAGARSFPADAVVLATRRKGVLPVSRVFLETQEGFLRTDAALQTSVPGIYAAGDVTGRSGFAHEASAQGLFVVNHLKGHRAPFDADHRLLCVYAMPEAAQIGATEPELRSRGAAFKSSFFPLSANGKALAEGQSGGFIRLLSDPANGRILGAQILADHATDMIAEASAIMQLGGSVYDLARTAHAHPTVSEVFLEAAGVANLPSRT
ncbi:MAG TPA: NAD(P)/FAD-dependent oxidoreductase, partial [Holophaga sp.]|nr:NAD(P)/FAD-dependent oxidoreductase [Holophaga sp.]